MEIMQYKHEPENKTLCNDIYRGFRYIIISKGYFPAAYVCLENKPVSAGDVRCHSGVTYSENYLKTERGTLKGTWIGWEYNQAEDYVAGPGRAGNGKKWTVFEILEEVREVIDGLKDLGYRGREGILQNVREECALAAFELLSDLTERKYGEGSRMLLSDLQHCPGNADFTASDLFVYYNYNEEDGTDDGPLVYTIDENGRIELDGSPDIFLGLGENEEYMPEIGRFLAEWMGKIFDAREAA